MTAERVVVFGQIGRDLVLLVDELPEPQGSAVVRERRELLGGKGANQAVALRQLGADVALVGVVGDDEPGRQVLAEAARNRIDVSGVAVRGNASTALLVDVVEPGGVRRLLEDVPEPVLLSVDDVAAARRLFASAGTVVAQSQQPAAALLAALQAAREAGCRTVLDGAPEPSAARELLGLVDVVRADQAEAGLLVGRELTDLRDVEEAAAELLGLGPTAAMLAAGDEGNVAAWPNGQTVLPLHDVEVVDSTGAGDAAVAALVVALAAGLSMEQAAERAMSASARLVQRLGGRPDLAR